MNAFRLALIACLLTGCATKMVGLRHDPSFKYETAISGKMAVGGIATLSDELKLRDTDRAANVLRAQIIEARETYNVAPMGVVMNALGKKQHQKLVSAFNETGTLSPVWLNTLKKKLPNQRYVVLSRVEGNDINKDRSESYDQDSKGNAIYSRSTIRSTVTRRVTTSFNIFDLQLQKSVWSGMLSKSARASNSFRKVDDKSIVGIIRAVKAQDIPDEQRFPYPEPPQLVSVLGDIYRGFAKNLPKED